MVIWFAHAPPSFLTPNPHRPTAETKITQDPDPRGKLRRLLISEERRRAARRAAAGIIVPGDGGGRVAGAATAGGAR